jgi:hypothetical protein
MENPLQKRLYYIIRVLPSVVGLHHKWNWKNQKWDQLMTICPTLEK